MITMSALHVCRVRRRGLPLLLASVLATMLLASPAPASFGVKEGSFHFASTNKDGSPDTQAGSHPYEVTSSFEMNTTTDAQGKQVPDGDVRDVAVELPPGLIGNPEAVPQCLLGELDSETGCPSDAQVGVITIVVESEGGVKQNYEPGIYNMVPRPGVPAEYGFQTLVLAGHLDGSVRTGGDYGVTVTSLDITEYVPVLSVSTTFWGVPADESHTPQRICQGSTVGGYSGPTRCPAGVAAKPLLRLPSSCSGEPLQTTIRMDSWEKPGEFLPPVSAESPALTGCYKLDFSPTVLARSDTTAADSPAGLHLSMSLPQNENPNGLGEADLRRAVVRLPAGVTLNPAAADGLLACSQEQVGLKNALKAACPDGSKIGAVSITTPLLPRPLNGAVYVAQQGNLAGFGSNPFGSLLAIYLVAEDPALGVIVKLAGKVGTDPVSGQLTTTFEENPPLPFSELTLDLFGGPRGVLVTPRACGTYTTTAVLTPWSAPESGPPATPSDPHFAVTTGCAPAGFAPSFVAGSASNQAGAFSPLTVTLSRQDGEQRLSGVSVKTPAGLLGMLSKVTLCGEAQANAGTCPDASRIGHVTVGAGAGPDPVFLPQAGKPQDPVYLTGPYEGAPFGLSIVTPAEAGPFNLGENGRPVVVRAAVNVDPTTAQITITSDPLPTILQGIPLDVRTVNVTVDREGFMFNPTNCGHLSIEGTMTSSEGASAAVSTPFQVTNCATLAFKPTFKASTSGKTSRKNGASLDVKLSYPKGSMGKDANIRSVKVNLPKQLPSRLTTLQQACPDSTFNANPASCPAGSKVGGATATTPVLPGVLSGPAYFVSHGGAKFPELIVVLQGDGVTVDLHGETFISKAGITSSTFRQVPDVPVDKFELKLPTGPNSALAANGNLCKSKLAMPTAFTAQNGLTIHQSTPIAVTGCPKPKKAKKGAGLKK
jgi:hypothetical protein